MTREELKAHCLKQIEGCEMWAKVKEKEPSGKVYEEHRLILELLEQESVLDKIIAEIEKKIIKRPWLNFEDREKERNDAFLEVLDIIDKYKAGSEK